MAPFGPQAAEGGEAEEAPQALEGEGLVMARRGDWVPCRGYGLADSVTPASESHTILVKHGDDQLAVPGVSVIEETDDIVVERVVGQWGGFTVSEDTVRLCLRIRVAIYDDNSDSLAFYADDLFGAEDANEPFLWQRYVELFPGVTPLQVSMHPGWSMIDVRVARKLSREQALVLTVACQSNLGSPQATVTMFLRSWARRG